MYKRQHYALEHSARDSTSSGSSSSLDTSSDADSGGPEQSDDAAWPASSHESDEKLQEEDVAEVQSSASVAERRAKAILIAERKLAEAAEAAEDIGEFEEGADRDGDNSRDEQQSGGGAESSASEGSSESEGDCEIREAYRTNGAVLNMAQAVSDSDDQAASDSDDADLHEELLAQRKVSNQWAEAVDEDDLERPLDRFEGNTVICVGDQSKIYRCKVCPKIICLNEETMQMHLSSKRHARSLKQLAEGRLKVKLDSDGEEDEEGETHAERHARTVAAVQELKEKSANKKRDSGRQRQRRREKAKKAHREAGDLVQSGTGKNRRERRAQLHAGSAGLNDKTSFTVIKGGGKVSGGGGDVDEKEKTTGGKLSRSSVGHTAKSNSKLSKKLSRAGSNGDAVRKIKRPKLA
ncbi:hypothetical protein R1flu_025006 [Riccia fluitans]|uniref:C2H2-type domain-containing protein n=1 Tax=Riccia fluitans TaxID=41844 RepID=A0ABD1XWK0_9MARC